ncbi:CCA tRNA nucleotidyltransferase [Chthonobacter rhizosphaerae]|uniref:CCA tRNA nucleotidyltransferase n=1 Tax=Chthonobacter rhizosphaerae TaxID=2735553 RepID=UPI0015EFA505|nr:CCA tRNA nucleotidyltransferase [Chthonobacter rhizosphaerae]
MTAAEVPTSIAGAPFLQESGFRAVVRALAVDGTRVRAVGGAVRNTLLGEPVADVDLATDARPQTVMERASRAGLKAVPTGIEHGTVTVVAKGRAYEVTTLRADVETDGRRAVVAFTDDFAEDAARRDFTMNAIYADADGTLHDPVGGVPDALARRVRFIGDPEARIREDYLRILRFFRFHAVYGEGEPDPAGLAACRALKEGLDRLSRERVGQETRKLAVAERAAETLDLMKEIGILERVLGRPGEPAVLGRLAALASEAGVRIDAALAIAAVSSAEEADAAELAERLRLSNADRDRIAAVAALAGRIGPETAENAVREAVYREGNATTLGALLLSAARQGSGLPATVFVARDWTAPAFPLTGADLIREGLKPGPELGRVLKEREAAWIASGFGERKQ